MSIKGLDIWAAIDKLILEHIAKILYTRNIQTLFLIEETRVGNPENEKVVFRHMKDDVAFNLAEALVKLGACSQSTHHTVKYS